MTETEPDYVTREACTLHSQQLMKSQKTLLEKLESIEKRLFKDNGRVSMQTRLDRHEQVLRLLLWGLGIVGGTLLSGIGLGLALMIREAVVFGGWR